MYIFLDVVLVMWSLCCLQYLCQDDGEVVILEDASVDRYVAVGERKATYFPPTESEGESSGDGKLI
jgi:hypothetical protein